jgi:methylthioribulose-1-phosphate dehydratase
MEIDDLKSALVQTIRAYHHRGWSPATSTNYSFKDDSNRIWVTRSGIDKSQVTGEDFILVDASGKSFEEVTGKIPSAETLIHCVIYALFPEAKVVLHSHGKFPILAAETSQEELTLEGWEVQKGFDGVQTHDCALRIPIVENSQSMEDIDYFLRKNANEIQHHCFVIKRHGTYAWGKNIFEAKRHLETLDYLCEIHWELNK